METRVLEVASLMYDEIITIERQNGISNTPILKEMFDLTIVQNQFLNVFRIQTFHTHTHTKSLVTIKVNNFTSILKINIFRVVIAN